MTAAMAMPGNTAETVLVHFFGAGLTVLDRPGAACISVSARTAPGI